MGWGVMEDLELRDDMVWLIFSNRIMLADTLKIYWMRQGWSEYHLVAIKNTKIKYHHIVVKNENGEWIENWFNSEYI